MKSADQAAGEAPSSEPAASGLEDLIPIAVVIGAGCEACAASLVQRARGRGTPDALIARALGVVARVCAAECLVRALGPEAVGRMRRSLRAGEEALREADGRVRDQRCRG